MVLDEKSVRIHPLGTLTVSTKCNGNTSNRQAIRLTAKTNQEIYLHLVIFIFFCHCHDMELFFNESVSQPDTLPVEVMLPLKRSRSRSPSHMEISGELSGRPL